MCQLIHCMTVVALMTTTALAPTMHAPSHPPRATVTQTAPSDAAPAISVVMGAPMVLMYYRTDVFQAQQWAVPATWEALLSWARSANGTIAPRGSVSGQPAAALCLSAAPCKTPWLLMAIMASYTQVRRQMCWLPGHPRLYTGPVPTHPAYVHLFI